MAVQYAPTKLRVPPGFQNILEGFAREVLREQPEDIIQFGAQYFRAQLSIRDDTGKDDAKRGEQLEKLQKGEDIDIDLGDPQVQAAATKIQAGFRGHKAREDLKHKKEEEAAALKIQSSFRGHKAREEVKELRESKSRESAEVSPSKEVEKPVEDEVDIDLNDPEVQGAALKIQASFRGHKARTEVQKIKSSEAVAADVMDTVEKETSVTDQPTVDAPKEEEIDIDLNDPQVEKAASVIQSTFRAHKSRESVKVMTEKEDMEQEPKEDAVDKVEEITADEGDTSAPDKAEEVDIDLNDPDVHKAASKIQASFRGHKTRQELKDKSPSQSRESVKTEEPEPSAADEVAPETTFEQQFSAETESESQEAVETHEVPAETQDTPAESQEVPAETQEIPTETQKAPEETQESPAEYQEAPVDADTVDKAEDAASESVDVVQEAQSESPAEAEGQETEDTPDGQESIQQEDDTDKPETVAEASQPTTEAES